MSKKHDEFDKNLGDIIKKSKLAVPFDNILSLENCSSNKKGSNDGNEEDELLFNMSGDCFNIINIQNLTYN